MPNNDRQNLPKMLRQGKVGKSQVAKPPEKYGSGGSIMTDWKDIKWTPKKLALIIATLGIPYLIMVVSLIKAGYTVVVFLMIGLAILTGLIYLALRWIEKSDW